MDKKCTAMGCKNGKVALLIGFVDCKECNGTGVIASETNYSEDLDVTITNDYSGIAPISHSHSWFDITRHTMPQGSGGWYIGVDPTGV
jgi:hypothetical protein